jgi:teichuronic acid biosynthesis glycosyltransferase TuaG
MPETEKIQFSVIIPVYNAAKTVERAIASVLEQSYDALEIIVVDDASKDNTAAIVQEKFAGKVQFIQKLVNQGSSATRNIGMDTAKGNYIAFLDADDVWHKDKLMLVKTILEATPDVSLFYHPFTQENILDKALPEDMMVYKLPFVKMLPGNVIATSCAVIRNDPKFRFETSMRYTEDYDLWLRIGYRRNVYFINIPLTQIYRPFLTKGGISENKWKMRRGEMKAYRRLIKLNPLFALLYPFLLVSSVGKHVYKLFFKS